MRIVVRKRKSNLPADERGLVDDHHQPYWEPQRIQSELAHLLVNAKSVQIIGIAPQPLLEAVRQITSRTAQEPMSALPPIAYYTPAPQIVLAHMREAAFGKVIRRWNSSMTALRNMLSGQKEDLGTKPDYTSYSIDELFLDCIVKFFQGDGSHDIVGLTALPGELGQEHTVMWHFATPPIELLENVAGIVRARKPLKIREIHCSTIGSSDAAGISSGSRSNEWGGPVVTKFLPYGVSANDQNFLMPAAIVVIRGRTHQGTIVYLKRRTPLTDHNDFGVLSLLSARVREEDLAFALNIDMVGERNDDRDALEDTWIKAGKPSPFTIPKSAFVHAAQRELYSSCGLNARADRLNFKGFQILDHETGNQQFCFAVFDFALIRSDGRDELRDLEAWNFSGMVGIDQDRLYAKNPNELPLNRLLKLRAGWLIDNVFSHPVIGMGELR